MKLRHEIIKSTGHYWVRISLHVLDSHSAHCTDIFCNTQMPNTPLFSNFCGAVEKELDRFRNCDVWYGVNPGNAGDALIASAAFHLFRQAGVRVHVIPPGESAPPGQIVFYAGGGNLVPEYGNAANFIARHIASARELILLPHSIRGHAELLAKLDGRVLLFCREAASLEYARKHAPNARIAPANDLALSLDARQFLDAGRMRAIWLSLISRRGRKLAWAARRFKPDMDGVFRNFRGDVEASGRHSPTSWDLSNDLGVDLAYEPRTFLAAWLFLNTLSRMQEIHTDRLHVGLGGVLLGKRVVLHDNNYGKISGVYHASLADLPNVTLEEGRQ